MSMTTTACITRKTAAAFLEKLPKIPMLLFEAKSKRKAIAGIAMNLPAMLE